MTFVVEKIESEQQRQELDGLRLWSPIFQGPPRLSKWAVDRNRGLYFVSFGGGVMEVPRIVALADKDGVVLTASGEMDATGPYEGKGISVNWNLTSVEIQRRCALRVEELVGALADALREYGYLGNVEATRSVTVTLAAPQLV